MTAYDAIIVGAGTAGSVVAARLSEDPDRRVLLVDAGAIPRSLTAVPSELLDARRVPGAEGGSRFNRWFPVRLTPDREWSVSRGRIGGGSSATNGAYFVRARPADFARWADPVWAPDAIAPLLVRLERDLDLGREPGHGLSGPMPVRRTRLDHPAAAAWTQAALDAGHRFERDKNGTTDAGVGAMPANASGGVRFSTATAYLAGTASRTGLDTVGDRPVRRVLIVGGRAVGVELLDGSRLHADLVVLAAGALTTPSLLLASGIGPAAALAASGLPAVVDAPGVGAQLSDHPQIVLEARPRRPLPVPVDGWAGALLHADVGGAVVEVLQSLVPMARLTGGSAQADAPLPFLVSVHAPEATGSMTLGPDGVAIEHGYLRTGADRHRMREAVRLTAEVLARPALAEVLRGPVDPAPRVLADDTALDAWIAAHLGTALHTSGTVPFRMADGSPGPVDATGTVRGVEGLVIADTSILPTAPSRGPANTAVLIGELVADRLRAA